MQQRRTCFAEILWLIQSFSFVQVVLPSQFPQNFLSGSPCEKRTWLLPTFPFALLWLSKIICAKSCCVAASVAWPEQSNVPAFASQEICTSSLSSDDFHRISLNYSGLLPAGGRIGPFIVAANLKTVRQQKRGRTIKASIFSGGSGLA